MAVQVVLLKNVQKLGKAGDIVKVKEGYARNFLLTYNFAKLATEEAIKESEIIKEERIKKEKKLLEEAQKMAQKIKDLVINIEKKSKKGKLFGSVSQADIEKALEKEKFTIPKDKIVIEEAIKKVGDHEVLLDFNKDVQVKLKIKVKGKEE